MAFTLTQLEAIEEAIGNGELKVEFDGKKVEYRSMDDLIKARDVVRSALVTDGTISATRQRVTVASFSKD